MLRLPALRAVAVASFTLLALQAEAADAAVERGAYLAAISGCSDCHTPGHFLGAPDAKRCSAAQTSALRYRAVASSTGRT